MLYPARMKRLRVLALDSYEEAVLQALHNLGSVEIRAGKRAPVRAALEKRAEQAKLMLRRVESLLDELLAYEREARFSLRALLFEKPSRPRFDRRLLRGDVARAYLASLEQRIRALKERRERLGLEVERLSVELEQVEMLEGFEIDLSELRGTAHTFTLAGIGPAANLPALLEELSTFHVSLSTMERDGQAVLVLIGLRVERDRVLGALLRHDFERLLVPERRGKPGEVIESYRRKLSELRAREEEVVKGLEAIAEGETGNLLGLKEFFENQFERAEVARRLERSERTFLIEGYVPERLAEQTVREVERACNGHAVVWLEDAQGCDDVPVLLENPEPIKAFQLLTKSYAMPRYGEIDPTVFIALWFPVFFGIMLTDAAYGVLLLPLSILLLRRFESQGVRDIGKMLGLSALCTIALGMVFGSVFGNLLQSFFHLRLGVFDILSRVELALILAILLGLGHLNLGLALGVRSKLQSRDFNGLVYEHLWALLLELSAALFLAWRYRFAPPILAWAAIATLVCSIGILIKRRGLFGMLEIPSFLGQWLSYTRLLALALATTGIALAVNMIGSLLLGSVLFTLGWIVLIGGHVFNFAVNAFGAFVHSMRLHYVEFFSMFYEGGGREFSPFKARRRYMRTGGAENG